MYFLHPLYSGNADVLAPSSGGHFLTELAYHWRLLQSIGISDSMEQGKTVSKWRQPGTVQEILSNLYRAILTMPLIVKAPY